MVYRGQDLDLRTPQTWRATASDLAGKPLVGARGRGPYSAADDGPIWVDDTILACTNHAFDVALAHRAGEVRVEHLIHSMTRIDDAAEVLETSGVRVAALRRDMATIIASEIPVGLINGTGSPRTSDTLEKVLRLACAHAGQSDQPAGVENLLYVLLELRPAGSGGELIERHLVRASRERQPMPTYRRPAAPAYAPPEPPRERVRRPAGRFLVNDASSSEPVQSLTDNLQNSRLDALEQLIRAMSLQLTSQRDDSGRFTGGLMDRLQSLEIMVSDRQPVGLDAIEAVLRRIDGLELTVRNAAPREVNIDLGAVLGRLDQIEAKLRDQPAPPPPVDLSPLSSRLDQIDWKIGALPPQPDLSFVTNRLDQIEWKLGALPQQQTDINPLMLRIGQVEGLVRDSQPIVNVDLSAISNRLDIIEEALLGRDGVMSGDLDGRVTSLTETVSLLQVTTEEARASLTADVREVAASLAEQSSRIARTGEGIAELVGIVEAERTDDANALAAMSQSVEAFRGSIDGLAMRLEAEQQSQRHDLARFAEGVDGMALRAAEASQSHQADLKEVHDALMKLNANQHTLAGAIDQWRSDAAGDLTTIAGSIAALEREAGRPMAMLGTLSTNMDQMHKLTVERYYRRNRFWYWLYGTDDWVAASWPSQAERIETERKALASGAVPVRPMASKK